MIAANMVPAKTPSNATLISIYMEAKAFGLGQKLVSYYLLPEEAPRVRLRWNSECSAGLGMMECKAKR